MKYDDTIKLLEIADKEFEKKDAEKGITKRVMFCFNGSPWARMEGSFNVQNLEIIKIILVDLDKKLTKVI